MKKIRDYYVGIDLVKSPYFIFSENNEIIFGSEIKFIEGMTEKKFELNFDKIEDFLRYGYKSLNKDDKSYFKKINSVPPGHLIRINNNKSKIVKYWNISYKPSSILKRKRNLQKYKRTIIKVY